MLGNSSHSFKESRNDISRVMCRPKGRCLSFILTLQLPASSSSLPPGKDGPSLCAGIFGLATYRMCGMSCLHVTRWALTPPFHPYRLFFTKGGGSFLSHCPRRRRRLAVNKYIALCCPDFPLRNSFGATDLVSAILSIREI